ncbi:tRNA modification GTPase MnmE [Striga asiatica]|uniref:tRNA modification GTPase MnmE n=1 Tax=Striga asiatica TaxID=4170 RepID=A0A5A7PPH9_STRAF|nr:tRNA modification GTPase MnmE [Striga asiatica]
MVLWYVTTNLGADEKNRDTVKDQTCSVAEVAGDQTLVSRIGDKRHTNSTSRRPSGMTKTNDNVHEGGTCKTNESTVSTRVVDDQTKKDGKRKANRDVSCAKRVKIVPTSNQPDSSDDFVEECPRTRHVKSTIKHKGEGKVPTFVQEFTSKTRILANIGVEILRLVEKAP